MNSGNPYKTLGQKIKTLRQSKKKSQADICSALELDIKTLEKIESGLIRPSEDILTLLTNHLGVKEEEATRLFEAAGYKSVAGAENTLNSPSLPVSENSILMMINDARIVYTDNAKVDANENGITISFKQTAPNGKPMAVARVGLSREHAKRLLGALWSAIDRTRERKPAPPNSNQDIA